MERFSEEKPSQLFAQRSKFQNEFDTFLTQNLVTFIHLVPIAEHGKGFPDGFDEFKNCDSFKLLREAREKQSVKYLNVAISPELWHLHRSTLPFTPMSSPFHKLYGHLSDPVRIFTISGEFSGHGIPLKKVDSWGVETDYDAQFNDPDIRNGIVTCAALSFDGHHVALGFGSGVIELADIDHQHTISRFQLDPPNHPVWIEFVHGSHRVAAEDNEGNVTILSHDMTAVNLGTLPNNLLPAVTRVSDNGLFIIRVPRNADSSWYDSLTLISILGDPHLQHLAPPSSNNFTPTPNPPILASEPSTSSSASIKNDPVLTIPHRRTLGFSPGARYIGAFDGLGAFTWSTASIHHCEAHAGYNLDESWIKCPFYVLLQKEDEWGEWQRMWQKFEIHSSTAGRTPLFGTDGGHTELPMLFNGKLEFIIPKEYRPVVSSDAQGLGAWYGDQVPSDPTLLYSPRSSKDGTRILLQGWQTAPIVVDLCQVI
ncbi:uncharacterized protein EI90DRAFT_158755 [Cantharellus anzutake]|uniref:uncharacterized protein n=1 Tax=Cantharellus anzutake TaxID=1750568 RepID=UPI0019084048|nr:uncharacterized protein EI90DRAFT_158755 [Cantharellus anzutake]KAF8336315.1 hypothetical protein EI90DRAFT_158755 [Cantharellus anzutake]